MAATVTVLATIPTKDNDIVFATVGFDSSYPTGGEAVTAADLGLSGIVTGGAFGADDAKYHAYWDNANRKMILYVEDGTTGIEAQAANTSDQSAVVIPAVFVGY